MTRYPQADCKDAVPEPWNCNQACTGFCCCLIVNNPPLVVLFSFTMCTDPKEVNAFISSKTFLRLRPSRRTNQSLMSQQLGKKKKTSWFLRNPFKVSRLCVHRTGVEQTLSEVNNAACSTRLHQRNRRRQSSQRRGVEAELKDTPSPPTPSSAFIISDSSES